MLNGNTNCFIAIAIAALILLMLLIVFVAKYQTAKPDEALIISGSYLGSKMYTKMKVTTKSKSCEEAERSSCGFPTFESNQSIIQQIGRFYSRSVYRTRCMVMCDGTSIIKIGSSVEEIATAAEQF